MSEEAEEAEDFEPVRLEIGGNAAYANDEVDSISDMLMEIPHIDYDRAVGSPDSTPVPTCSPSPVSVAARLHPALKLWFLFQLPTPVQCLYFLLLGSIIVLLIMLLLTKLSSYIELVVGRNKLSNLV